MLWLVGNSSRDFDMYCSAHDIKYKRFTAVESKANGENVVFVDMHSPESLKASLQTLQPRPDVSAVFVAGYEHYVLPAAIIAEYFGVAGPGVSAATATTDKILMRQAFQAASPAITPDFAEVKSWEDVEVFMQRHDFPVMLKPANLMKSLYVVSNHDVAELKSNFEYLCTHLPAIYDQYRLGKPRILIEEMMTGSMHTIAGFVDASGEPHLIEEIVDCVTARDIGAADSYLFSRRLPSHLSPEKQHELLLVANKAVRALGLTSSPLHIELMLTAEGPKVIEIGARVGGYRPRMYELATGINLYNCALAVANNQELGVRATVHDAMSVIELFPSGDGILADQQDDFIRQLPTFHSLQWKTAVGSPVGPARHGFRATVIVDLVGEAKAILTDEVRLHQEFHISIQ